MSSNHQTAGFEDSNTSEQPGESDRSQRYIGVTAECHISQRLTADAIDLLLFEVSVHQIPSFTTAAA